MMKKYRVQFYIQKNVRWAIISEPIISQKDKELKKFKEV